MKNEVTGPSLHGWRSLFRRFAAGPRIVVIAAFLVIGGRAFPESLISTVAGGGTLLGDGISATSANIGTNDVAFDSVGNLYVADAPGCRIWRVRADTGLISTVAGTGTGGYNGDGIPATSAKLNWPTGVAVDDAGNVYISDVGNFRIRKVSAATGLISTVAGTGTWGYNGDGIPATSAQLVLEPGCPPCWSPGIAVDGAGNIYIADSGNNRVRKVSAATGLISTVAGNGTGAYNGDGIPATSAYVNRPARIALDVAGNIYIADSYNQRIRKVSAATGLISTVAGSGSVTWSVTWGGATTPGSYAGDGGPATSAELYDPDGIAVDCAGNLYIAEYANNRIRLVSASTGLIKTFAGTGWSGYNGDGIPAETADLWYPAGIAIGATGDLYFADLSNRRIRKVTNVACVPPYVSPPEPIDTGKVKIVGGVRGYLDPKRGEQATILVRPATAGDIRVRIYTMEGALVKDMVRTTTGGHTEVLTWDATDAAGRPVPSGVYPIFIEAPGIRYRDKLVVVR